MGDPFENLREPGVFAAAVIVAVGLVYKAWRYVFGDVKSDRRDASADKLTADALDLWHKAIARADRFASERNDAIRRLSEALGRISAMETEAAALRLECEGALASLSKCTEELEQLRRDFTSQENALIASRDAVFRRRAGDPPRDDESTGV